MRTTGKTQVSLYFHIPFCTRKCPYCHFYVIPNKPRHHQVFYDALLLEWNLQKAKLENKEIVSIYFGGGTPSLFAEFIPNILSWTQETTLHPDCEITVETNPEDVTDSLIQGLKRSGINRMSLGVQSLDDSSLQILKRTHNAKKALDSIDIFMRNGLTNFSVDLMYDLPNQTLGSWSRTLDQIETLDIAHLSLYNLTIEKHTAFYKEREELKKRVPNSELSLKMLDLAVNRLEEMGLQRYEISAFSKPGFESQHNLGYWSSRPYLGLGPSACSYWEQKRWKNTPNLNRYARDLQESTLPVESVEELEKSASIAEHFILHLRRIKGVCFSEIIGLFGPIPEDIQTDLKELSKKGYLCLTEKSCKLTKKGLLFYDFIASELIRLPQP